jgi:hypothetical protein
MPKKKRRKRLGLTQQCEKCGCSYPLREMECPECGSGAATVSEKGQTENVDSQRGGNKRQAEENPQNQKKSQTQEGSRETGPLGARLEHGRSLDETAEDSVPECPFILMEPDAPSKLPADSQIPETIWRCERCSSFAMETYLPHPIDRKCLPKEHCTADSDKLVGGWATSGKRVVWHEDVHATLPVLLCPSCVRTANLHLAWRGFLQAIGFALVALISYGVMWLASIVLPPYLESGDGWKLVSGSISVIFGLFGVGGGCIVSIIVLGRSLLHLLHAHQLGQTAGRHAAAAQHWGESANRTFT